jgi:hypothetical protein
MFLILLSIAFSNKKNLLPGLEIAIVLASCILLGHQCLGDNVTSSDPNFNFRDKKGNLF